MNNLPPAISFKNVNFSFADIPVLHNVSFEVGRTDAISVIGPNGGGKTTLLKLILGLLQPDSGEIRILGKPPRQMVTRIGYMPQYLLFDPQFPVTVMDIALMGRLGERWIGLYTKKDRSAAKEALDELGLLHLRNRLFSDLSGGERQRVLIARALACKPDILLLDEATSNVDVLAEARLIDIVKRLSDRMTILLVSHDIGFVSDFFRKVICVNKRVFVHDTHELDPKIFEEIYGEPIRLIGHHKHAGER